MRCVFLISIYLIVGTFLCGCTQQNNGSAIEVEILGLDSLVINQKKEQEKEKERAREKKRERELQEEQEEIEQKEVEQSYRKSAREFRWKAWFGDAEAQLKLATLYMCGKGVELSIPKAVKWYTKAAENGQAEAQYMLAHCYYFGAGVERDKNKGIEWMLKSAEQDFIDAQRDLSVFYAGVNNEEECIKWYLKALERDPDETKSDLKYSNLIWFNYLLDYDNIVHQLKENRKPWYKKPVINLLFKGLCIIVLFAIVRAILSLFKR